MLEFEILAQGLYCPEHLLIDYEPARRMPSTPEIQAWIDLRWEQQQREAAARQIRLYDAPLFRFIRATALKTSPTASCLHLVLGDTSYKEYVTTRQPEFAQQRARHELGNALSVCSVIETSDNSILLDKRQGVDGYVGRYHVIGGFFERHLDIQAKSALPDPFGAICREIREETGIQKTDIREQYCLGAVYDCRMPHAELCFLTRLHIPLSEVLHQRYPEEDEIKQLHTLAVSEASLRTFIVQHHGNISATGEPNLLFYGAWKFGMDWFREIFERLAQ